ncbi:S66 peptidase family protein [Flavobacterium sp. JP2137]|uniref:S66 peptidase family protein n=1 Tax=Flavobacterium sp. JP2137 TaxID=3414510 RepID=UPI003D2FE41A
MKTPPYLSKGDTVALVCTARKFSLAEAQPAIQLLEQWGLKVKLGATIGLDNFQLGGSDQERIADFQNQLDDPQVQAIWCARGGYGTVRIIDQLCFERFCQAPKWIIGFSDVTVLHSHINNLEVETLHAIMAFSVPNTAPQSIASLKHVLFGQPTSYRIPTDAHNRIGSATGELVGGNLSILYSLAGSKSAIDTAGKILFIEDLDEYLYHIDRMMVNVDRNGWLKNLKGLVVGGMTDMKDNAIPFGWGAKEIIVEISKKYDFPICFEFPAGHVQENVALMLGHQVRLNVEETGVTLDFL